MLNLSDKELDHFAKEAAQEYDPGDVLGASSWEGMEIRLDRDLGKVHLNPLRHIRRFPFYYAPAMLVLLGVSYYLIRRTVGPPGRMAKPPAAVVQNSSSSQSPDYKKTTTLDSSAATPTLPAEQAGGKPVDGGEVGASAGAAWTTSGARTSAAGTAAGAGTTGAGETGTGAASARTAAAGVGKMTGAHQAGATGSTSAIGAAGSTDATGSSMRTRDAANAGAHAAHMRGRNHHGENGRVAKDDNALAITAPANAGRVTNGKDADRVMGATGNTQTARRGELGRVALQGLRPTKKAPFISDSALRAFTLKSTAPQLIRRGGLHINRSLALGILAAPDFASVNSLAGDRPGSTIGVTVDYQFANHLYIGSGLLLDRKIFSAYGQDFHAPAGFYAANGLPDR